MIRNLGQVAAIYIGSSAPRNTNLIWLDNTVVPFVFRAYDGSAWSEIATHKWVRAYVDGWLVTLPPRQLADDGDYMLINSNNVNYKITVKDFVKSAVGNPLDFKGVIRVSADFPNPSTLESGDMYVIITSPAGGTVTDPYSGKTFEDSEKIVWDEVTQSWESLGKIDITVDLTTSYSETEVTIHSSAGKETTIQGATDQLAGVMLPGQYSWLQALSNGSIVPGDPSPLTPLTPAHKHNYNDIINRLVSQQGTGESTIDPMSQKATTDALNLKFDKVSVLQVSGAATDKVMSQKAVTDALKTLSDDFNNKLTNYLPLAGGTMKGSIRFPAESGIIGNADGTRDTYILRSFNNRLDIGSAALSTRIISNASDLLHHRSDTSYKIWDAYNLPTPASTTDLANYLPLIGGTLSGNLTINTVGSTTFVINNNDTNGSETFMRVLRKGTASAAIGFRDSLGAYIYNYNSNKYLFIDNDGYARVGTTSGSTRLALITDIPTVSGYLPLSGGTMSGNISFNGGTGHIVVGARETSNFVSAVSFNKGSATNSAYIGYHSTGGSDSSGALILVPYPTSANPWAKTVGLYIAKNELLLDGKAIATQEYVTWNNVAGKPTIYERTIGINGTYWSFYAPINATSAMIYGPTSAGISGQILQSTGGVPTWVNASSIVGNFVSKSGDTMTGALTMNSRRNNIVVDVVGGAGNSWDEGAGALSIQVPNDSGQTPLILARRSGAAINTTVATERLLSMELLDTGHSFIIGMSGSEALQLDWTSGKAGTGKLFGKTIATTDQIPSIPSISISNSGSGNAVTAISASGHTLTVTKGATYLTSHQTIYNLTFQAGTFAAKTFDPNGAAATVNIPTNTSHLTNDSGFITSSALNGYATQAWVNSQNFVKSTSTKKVTDIQPVDALPATQVSGVLYLVFG